MSDIKLTYFSVKALAEAIRMLLKYGGVDFADIRIERFGTEWPEVKPNMPFGQLPILEENGKVAHQSVALTRYVAKKVKLIGNDDWENLEIDAIVDTINDFRAKIASYYYEKNEIVKEALKEPLFQQAIPYYLEKFEQIAKQNNGHFALNRLTWADFYFVGMHEYLNSMVDTNLYENYPNLNKVVENVFSIPPVKIWVEARPVTVA
ncbi:Glutathione S-transferase [Oryctes borbonicus]|uniref:glutathione transferase n=1 Tax=Oryctes borbonicus TaxID=1629725 RepID=A0A0T6AX05_9SCAR|nr:Glutathione S-transferase [Oryctes borbonicus]